MECEPGVLPAVWTKDSGLGIAEQPEIRRASTNSSTGDWCPSLLSSAAVDRTVVAELQANNTAVSRGPGQADFQDGTRGPAPRRSCDHATRGIGILKM